MISMENAAGIVLIDNSQTRLLVRILQGNTLMPLNRPVHFLFGFFKSLKPGTDYAPWV
jgi:hypothetical protein